MKKKAIAILMGIALVLSVLPASYAAPYDFVRKSDKKVFSILDVATKTSVLLEIATKAGNFEVELQDGNKYDFETYRNVAQKNKGISESDLIKKIKEEIGGEPQQPEELKVLVIE